MKKPFFILTLSLFLAGLSCAKKESPRRPTSFQAPTPVFMEVQGSSPTPSQLQAQAPTLPEETATPEPIEYVVENIKGKVLILSKGTTLAEPAEEEETVEGGDEILTQAGSEADLTLNENTMFHLSENGHVKVSQLTPNDSKGFLSRLELIKGKILCEVEKLKESKSTFEVESGGVVCGVRGTAFEVFKEGTELRTSTFHGEVEVKKDNSIQRVKANQLAIFAFTKRAFLAPKALSQTQKNWYQTTWSQRRTVIQERRVQRMAVLHSLNNLPPAQRAELFQNLRQVHSKNRLRTMHQFIKIRQQENNRFRQKGNFPSSRNEKEKWDKQNTHYPQKNLGGKPNPPEQRDNPRNQRSGKNFKSGQNLSPGPKENLNQRSNGRNERKSQGGSNRFPEKANRRWDRQKNNQPGSNSRGTEGQTQGIQPSPAREGNYPKKEPGHFQKQWKMENRRLNNPQSDETKKNSVEPQPQNVKERAAQPEKAADKQSAPGNLSPLQKLFQGQKDRPKGQNWDKQHNGGMGRGSQGEPPKTNHLANPEKKKDNPTDDLLGRGQSAPEGKQKPVDLKNLFQNRGRRGNKGWEKPGKTEEKLGEKTENLEEKKEEKIEKKVDPTPTQ